MTKVILIDTSMVAGSDMLLCVGEIGKPSLIVVSTVIWGGGSEFIM